MRPHPVRPTRSPTPSRARRPRRRPPWPLAVVLLTAALVVAVPAGAATDPFAGQPAVDAVLRYPLRMPVDGRVESLIGGGCPSARAHTGVDVSSPGGAPAPVHAVHAGFARAVETGNGYGLSVEIVHFGDGTTYLSRYAHLGDASIRPGGQWVAAGEVIGTTGASGNAQTVHLHFELRDPTGAAVDLNPAFRPCRRDVRAGDPLALDVPGLVAPQALEAAALGPNTWAATGVGPTPTAPGAPDCRYWSGGTTREVDRCSRGGGDDGVDGSRGGDDPER